MGEGFAELTAFRSCRPGVAGGIAAASTVPNEVFGFGVDVSWWPIAPELAAAIAMRGSVSYAG